MVLKTDWVDADACATIHASEHNASAVLVNDLETKALNAGGGGLLLQDVYDHGVAAASSITTIDSTRSTVAIHDNATPTGLNLLRVGPLADPLLAVSITAAKIGDSATFATTVEGVFTAGRGATDTVDIGLATTGAGTAAVTIGKSANGGGNNGVAVGTSSRVDALDGVAVGNTAYSVEARDIAIGKSAYAEGPDALALGGDARAETGTSTALGSASRATGTNTTAAGTGAAASGTSAQAFGTGASAAGNYSMAIGDSATTLATATEGVAVGRLALCSTADGGVAVGHSSLAQGDHGVAVGHSSDAAQNAVAIGENSTAGGDATDGGIGIGNGVNASVGTAIALGANSSATAAGAVAIGISVAATTANDFLLGSATHNVQVAGTLAVTGTCTISSLTTIASTAGLSVQGPVAIVAADAIFKAQNTTASDTDDTRTTSYIGQGKTLAGVLHVLGAIDFRKDATSTDQKGKTVIRVNTGASGSNPVTAATFDGDKNLTTEGDVVCLGELEIGPASQAAKSDTSGLTADRAITYPDVDRHLGDFMIFDSFEFNSLSASQTGDGTYHIRVFEFRVAYPGELVMITATANGTPAAGHSATARVKVNGVLVGTAVTVDNSNPDAQQAQAVTVAAGDNIRVQFVGGGTWANRNVSCCVYIRQRVYS